MSPIPRHCIAALVIAPVLVRPLRSMISFNTLGRPAPGDQEFEPARDRPVEGTAIVMSGDGFQVTGKSKVAIHYNTRLYRPGQKPISCCQRERSTTSEHGGSKSLGSARPDPADTSHRAGRLERTGEA